MLRFKEKETYKPSELVYAAEARCPCGAGLAYPKGCGAHHYWDCSAILLGKAEPKDSPAAMRHTAQVPFAFCKVRSERADATTRPRGLSSSSSGSNCDYPGCQRRITVDDSGMDWDESQLHYAWVLKQQGWIVWRTTHGANHYLCPEHADKAEEMRDRFPSVPDKG